MAEKLNLHATAYPHPYHVHWVNQDKGLPVKSRSLISFTIGKHYQDQTWYDVIPMHACHVMLGRPWLYDRKVIDNCHLNTYSLSKGGKTITLTPLNPTQLKNSKPQKSKSSYQALEEKQKRRVVFQPDLLAQI